MNPFLALSQSSQEVSLLGDGRYVMVRSCRSIRTPRSFHCWARCMEAMAE